MLQRLSYALLVTLVACNAPTTETRSPISTDTTDATADVYDPTGLKPYREFLNKRLRDENGHIPPDGHMNALAERDAMLTFQQMIDGGGIGNLNWEEHGPANIGGRTRAILIHPTIPTRLFAGSAGGGIWRSDNSGSSWYPLDDFMRNLSVSCMAFDPSDPNVIYAGTGEDFNNNVVLGGGIFRSLDGGDSWNLIGSTSMFGRVSRIAISPANTDEILIGTNLGLYQSLDGGSTWHQRQSRQCTQVLFDPNDPTRCMASLRKKIFGIWVHTIVWSLNGGITWTAAAAGYPTTARIELGYAKSVPGMVYATMGLGQVWRSTDDGHNWSPRTLTPIASDQWGYNNAVWVDPFDANIVVVGFVHIYRSLNGAQSFTQISNGGINTTQPHPDHHVLVAHPGYNGTTNRTVYNGNDGGIWRTSDIRTASTSSGWVSRDTNFRTVQFYGVAGHSSGRIAGGTQDNGTLTINSNQGQNALVTHGGDGGMTQMDPNNPNYIWGETQNIYVHRSTNGGISASGMVNGLLDQPTKCTLFIAPLVSAPSNTNILLAGGCSLWRCSNAKAATPSWTSIRGPMTSGDRVSAIAVFPTNPNYIWVGYESGQVYRTSNGLAVTPSWSTVDDNFTVDILPNRFVTRIMIDRTDVNTAYVTFGGFASDNLWRTTDNGNTWTDATGTANNALPTAPVYGIAQHPTLADRFYVATEVGVYGTSDDMDNWSSSNDGPAAVACFDISFLHGSTTLLVGTFGRGAWTTTIHEPNVTSFGTGCAGSNGVPVLYATAPRIGRSVFMTGNNLNQNDLMWLVRGDSNTDWFGVPLPADLTSLQAPGCFLRVRPDIVHDATADASGQWSTTMPIPPLTALLGHKYYMQIFSHDQSANGFGVSTSNALEMTIGN